MLAGGTHDNNNNIRARYNMSCVLYSVYVRRIDIEGRYKLFREKNNKIIRRSTPPPLAYIIVSHELYIHIYIYYYHEHTRKGYVRREKERHAECERRAGKERERTVVKSSSSTTEAIGVFLIGMIYICIYTRTRITYIHVGAHSI